jgi:hypothetical protein
VAGGCTYDEAKKGLMTRLFADVDA